MRKDLEKLFERIERPEPGDFLLGRIMARVEREEKTRAIYRKIFIFSACAILSAVAFYPAAMALKADLNGSGFLEVVSVALSDRQAMAYWKEMAFSILEALPAASISLSLLVFLALCASLKYLGENIKMAMGRPKLGYV